MSTDLERFLATDGRAEAVQRVRAEIDAKGITYIYYQFASVTGRIMGKGAPADHWERMAQSGFQLVYGSTANLFIDRHGNYIGYGPEASELVGLPDVETFCQLPWDPKTARVFCTLFRNREEETDPGGFLTSDCRGNLRRIHEEFERETGLHMRVGTEPEMMWLKTKPDGTPSVDGMTKPYCYHIDQFSELQPVIHKVMEYSKAMGLDMIQGDHEDAPGQLELNWMFDRAEATADRLTTYRQICRQVGRELGVFPCFMPKPFMGVSANGCHHNISLWQGDENMFLPDGDNPRHPEQARAAGHRRDAGPPRRADLHHRAHRELLPAVLGHRLLGAAVRRLGLPEPDHRAAGQRPGTVRVPVGGLRGQPVPVLRRDHQGDGRRHQAQPRPGAARGPEHLRGHRGRQGRQEGPDDAWARRWWRWRRTA